MHDVAPHEPCDGVAETSRARGGTRFETVRSAAGSGPESLTSSMTLNGTPTGTEPRARRTEVRGREVGRGIRPGVAHVEHDPERHAHRHRAGLTRGGRREVGAEGPLERPDVARAALGAGHT